MGWEGEAGEYVLNQSKGTASHLAQPLSGGTLMHAWWSWKETGVLAPPVPVVLSFGCVLRSPERARTILRLAPQQKFDVGC